MTGRRPLPLGLLAAQTASFVGSSAYATGAVWATLAQSGDNRAVAALITVTFLPGLLLSPLLGIAVDRLPRRALAAGADAVRAAALVLWAAAGLTSPVALLGLSLLLAALDELHDPAFSALLRDRTPQTAYERVLSAVQVATQLGWMAGAVLGGAALAFADLRWGLLLNAASFVVSAGLTMRGGRPAGDHDLLVTDRVSGPPRRVWPLLRRIWALVALLGGLGAMLQVSNMLLPGYVRAGLGLGPLTFGTLDALYALGALLGAGLVVRLGRRSGWLIGGVIVCLAALAWLPTAFSAAVAITGLGVSLSVRVALWGQLQRVVPSALQGRVHAVVNALISLAAICAVALGAAVSSPQSARLTYLGLAVAGGLILPVLYARAALLRR